MVHVERVASRYDVRRTTDLRKQISAWQTRLAQTRRALERRGASDDERSKLHGEALQIVEHLGRLRKLRARTG